MKQNKGVCSNESENKNEIEKEQEERWEYEDGALIGKLGDGIREYEVMRSTPLENREIRRMIGVRDWPSGDGASWVTVNLLLAKCGYKYVGLGLEGVLEYKYENRRDVERLFFGVSDENFYKESAVAIMRSAGFDVLIERRKDSSMLSFRLVDDLKKVGIGVGELPRDY